MRVKMQIVGYGTVKGDLCCSDNQFQLTYRLIGWCGPDNTGHPGSEFFVQTGKTLSDLISKCAELGMSDIKATSGS